MRYFPGSLRSKKRAQATAREFADLVGRVINATVSHAPIKFVELGDEPWECVVGHMAGRLAPSPMPLGNGHHLLVWQRLGLRRPERYLTTLQYRYVYQATVDDESWIFRYEYDREPEGAYPYSRCHVHVNATPATYSGREPFPDLHLPAGERVTIEEVVRHLVVEHGVTPVSRDWEKTLEEAATDWAEIQSRRRASR